MEYAKMLENWTKTHATISPGQTVWVTFSEAVEYNYIIFDNGRMLHNVEGASKGGVVSIYWNGTDPDTFEVLPMKQYELVISGASINTQNAPQISISTQKREDITEDITEEVCFLCGKTPYLILGALILGIWLLSSSKGGF